jgi:Tfp pilus assembly protein PilF
VLAELITGDLFAYDAVLAEPGSEVPAADVLARAWSADPLAAITHGAPRPVPAWSDFGKTYRYLLSNQQPLSLEQWAAAADFAAQTADIEPVAAILLGLLVITAWEESEAGNERQLFMDDQATWQKVFLPLAQSLLRANAVWSSRPLCKVAAEVLGSVGWHGDDAVERDRIVARFRQLEAAASTTIRDAANELVWRLAASAGNSPDTRLDVAALCWLLGDSARAGLLRADRPAPSLDCVDFVVRRSLADVPADPFLEAGWQRLADSGVLVKSPELLPVYYRLTRTSQRQRLDLDFVVSASAPEKSSRLVYQAVKAWLSGHHDEIDRIPLREIFDRAKDAYFHDFLPAFVRVTALLLLATEASEGPTRPTHELIRWEWEKLAVGASEKLWNDTVDNVEGTSADITASLVFHFLPSRSAEERNAALELLEAYRSAGLEYALTVTPPLAARAREDDGTGRVSDDQLRAELRGLRFLQAIDRLPDHMRYYYGPTEDIGPDRPLSPQRIFDDETNRSRQQEVRAELERRDAGAYVRPKGYGGMRPGSGRVLIDFRAALGYRSVDARAGERDEELEQRLERAAAMRAAGDPSGAREQLEAAIALCEMLYGDEDARIADASNTLGNVLQRIGDLEAAERCYTRALAIHQAAYGFIHSAVAADWHNLGTLAYSRDQLQLARLRVQRALAIDTAVFGPQDAEVATDHMTLGRISAAGMDDAAACAHYRSARDIRQAIYGPDHPRTASAAAALAEAEGLAQVLGRFQSRGDGPPEPG